MESLKESMIRAKMTLTEAKILQVKDCRPGKLTPARVTQTGNIVNVFGMPFKIGDANGRKAAFIYAQKCGYSPLKSASPWFEFEDLMSATYGDNYPDKYAAVVAGPAYGDGYFFVDMTTITLLQNY